MEPSVKNHLRNTLPFWQVISNKQVGGKSVYTLDSRLKIHYVCHFFLSYFILLLPYMTYYIYIL